MYTREVRVFGGMKADLKIKKAGYIVIPIDNFDTEPDEYSFYINFKLAQEEKNRLVGIGLHSRIQRLYYVTQKR